MKMMGTRRKRGCSRIRPAVPDPSLSGMVPASRMTATSRSRSWRSASAPDCTHTTFSPSSESSASIDISLEGTSSTTRMLTRPVLALEGLIRRGLARQPVPELAHQLLGVHRLGQVVGRPGLHALLPLTLHGLGGHPDDRQAPAPPVLAHRPHRLQA